MTDRINRPVVRTGASVLALLLGACAGTPRPASPEREPEARVGIQFLIPEGAERHELDDDEFFVLPGFSASAGMPRFPQAALGGSIDATAVCIELFVDEQGSVYESHPLYGEPGCAERADPALAAFVEASLEAVDRWQFSPGGICRRIGDRRADDDCGPPHPGWQAVPLRLGFVFDFSQHRPLAGVQALGGG